MYNHIIISCYITGCLRAATVYIYIYIYIITICGRWVKILVFQVSSILSWNTKLLTHRPQIILATGSFCLKRERSPIDLLITTPTFILIAYSLFYISILSSNSPSVISVNKRTHNYNFPPNTRFYSFKEYWKQKGVNFKYWQDRERERERNFFFILKADFAHKYSCTI